MKRRKPEAQRKVKLINLRVTIEEKELLEAAARRKHLPLSRWLVIAALGGFDA
jgi:uncharacterized protein (DUF1778 family)